MSHVCLLGESDAPFLVSGDTLFNAGAGNCHNGGHPEVLFQTFRDCLWPLPDETELLPGHDYLKNNLAFSLSREPSNAAAKARLASLRPDELPRLTLGEERLFNPFFRLEEPELVDALREAFPQEDLSSVRARFIAMRQLRNQW
jgi:hydroxyacylglutathione hydrolase